MHPRGAVLSERAAEQCASRGAIPGEPYENDGLVDQVQLWTSRLSGAAPASGWQLSFELVEPEEDDATTWSVLFALNSLGDEKTIEAEKIWTDASPLSALGRQQ